MGDTNYVLSGVILQVAVSLWVYSSMSSSEFHVFFATGFFVPQELSKSQLCGGHHCREPPQWALRMSGKFSHQIIASSGTSSRHIYDTPTLGFQWSCRSMTGVSNHMVSLEGSITILRRWLNPEVGDVFVVVSHEWLAAQNCSAELATM